MSFKVPILFLVFNRPQTTIKVFEKIREIKPSFLYVAADGPRKDKPREKEICEQVRNIVLSNVDWECDVKTLFREENLGCGEAVSGAIDWFFKNVEEGIILEDDCLPNKSFFKYCEVMLNRYSNDNKVMHISGNNFQFGTKRGNGNYYYSILVHIWGWASWRRAWQYYQFDLRKARPISNESYNLAFNQNKLYTKYYDDLFLNLRQHPIDSWDYQWQNAIIGTNGLAICPNVNLVQNIGFGKDATHTLNETEWNSLNITHQLESFHSPNEMKIFYEADEFVLQEILGLRKYIAEEPGNFNLIIFKKIKRNIYKYLKAW